MLAGGLVGVVTVGAAVGVVVGVTVEVAVAVPVGVTVEVTVAVPVGVAVEVTVAVAVVVAVGVTVGVGVAWPSTCRPIPTRTAAMKRLRSWFLTELFSTHSLPFEVGRSVPEKSIAA